MQLINNLPVFEVFLGEKKYTLAFPLKSVVTIEEKLGKPMRQLRDWLEIQPKDMPAIIEAGLARFHAETAESDAAEIISMLPSEQIDELHYALCKLAFPKSLEKLEEFRKNQAESPNVESGPRES